jgi:galactose mutarotase-like enzyme
MENVILIHNEDRSLTAEVSPEYGGMITTLQVERRDVLYLDETGFPDSPFTTGGIPVMFPFAGKTKNDTYEIEGMKFYMPKHGLVKNRAFSIKDQTERTVTGDFLPND